MRKFYTTIFLVTSFLLGKTASAQVEDEKFVRELITRNAAQLSISTEGANNYLVSNAYTDKRTGIRYVYLQQTFQNIKVFNSIKTVIFRDYEVMYSSGNFVTGMEQKTGPFVPLVQAGQAVVNAAKHLDLPLPVQQAVVQNKFDAEKKIIFSPSGIARSNIETELFWVTADDGSWAKLAWNVNIEEARSADWWNVRIDALSGQFIEKNNWTVNEGHAAESDQLNPAANPGAATHAKSGAPAPFVPQKGFLPQPPSVVNADYYVVRNPKESPRHGGLSLEHNPWLRAGATNPAITNGWHFDGTTNYNITRGNNVHAYLDIANTNNPASAANTPVVSQTADPNLTFNYVPDFNAQPTTTGNRQTAVTNLFYVNNTIHDILYQYGFDEVSGNFQTDNIGRGGLGNDYVQAEAQDASGTNNANFATPADGTRPRMQMYLWSGVPLFRVNTPASIAGTYYATESGFSTNNKLAALGPITGQVVWYNDNGLPTGTHFACTGSTPGSLSGKIAMIIRGGGCVNGFIEKVKNAQNAGAIAVIMVNNVSGLPITMGGTDNTITIPAVMISDVDGNMLDAQLANNVNVTLAAGVGLDGDLDGGIITHEFGHGVSNRLTGGPANASCLANQEQGGEGWSDYLALMLNTNWSTATVNDGPLPRPVGVYALGHPLSGPGIRTAPYSTNLTNSPQTYTALPTMAVPHGIGEIWCSAIWDMTWNIIQQEGVINPDIFNSNAPGGNSIALRLVMEGMRIQTCRPGFLDGRDAILAADSILYNSKHRCAIWNAFARRGMGHSARQGSSNSVTDGTAAFDVPTGVTLAKTATPLTAVQNEMVAINIKATCDCQTNTNYTLRDTIPAGFTYVSSTGGTLSGNVVTFSNLSFGAPQQERQFKVIIAPNVAGCTLDIPVNDNRDGSTTGGLTSVIATGTTNWVPSNVRSSAASPGNSWLAASTAANKDFSLTTPSPGYAAGPLSIFSFNHFYVTENTLDGGRVEYSTNNGTTWLDAQKLILQNGYNNVASAAPWGANEKMYGGVSFGQGSNQFITSIVDLSSLNGQTVRLRLRSRSNATNNGTYDGWFVDDIKLMNGCGGIVRTGLYNGSGLRVDSLYNPVFIKAGTPVSITQQPANTTVCNGSNAIFSAAAAPATSPTYQWQVSTDGGTTWTDIPGATGTQLTVPTVTLAMAGNQYRVVATSGTSSGFVYSNAATLSVNPIPTVNVVPGQAVCHNTQTAAITFGGSVNGTSFSWTNNTPSIGLASSGTGNIPAFTATNATSGAVTATITVTPTYTNGGTTCSGTPRQFTIKVNPLPAKPVVVPVIGNGVHSSVTGAAYQWYVNGNIIPGATGLNYIPNTMSGQYQVKVTSVDGCENMSDPYFYIPERFFTVAVDGQFMFVYPLPASNNVVYVHFNLPTDHPVTYNFYTMLGQKMSGGTMPAGTITYTIDVKHLPSSNYVLKFRDYRGIIIRGVIVPVLRK